MKLNANQLGRQLKDELAPVFIVSGDDPLLTGEIADEIRRACRQAGCEERLVFHVDRSFDWGQLHDVSHSMSLFAQQRLIELRIPGGKPGDEGGKALIAWLEAPPPDTTLLISLPKLDASVQRSKWAKTLIEHPATRFVHIWPIEAQQLPGWMRDRLASVGIQATPEALDLLSARVEGNLLAASQEIEKLKLFCNSGVLDVHTVQEAVADSARFDVFNLADAMLKGEAQQALRVLHGLRGEGVEAPVVLWAIARELRSLASMAQDLARGLPLVAVNHLEGHAVSARLGAAAGELRDLTVLAWRASAESRVGWPAVSVAEVEADRYAAASELAQRYQAVVVLKGAGSIVAAPGRIPCVIDAGNPGMASGGMGDVLTGVIGALRAQRLDAFDAACLGALLHGAAGDAAAGDGQRGLLAMDLMPELRRLLADV